MPCRELSDIPTKAKVLILLVPGTAARLVETAAPLIFTHVNWLQRETPAQTTHLWMAEWNAQEAFPHARLQESLDKGHC
eukprot:6419206-Amphidinium_carterae.1